MKVIAVAGRRNAGKTSLIEALLEAIPPAETVSTVKSIHHDVDFDTAGTDTHRHRSAGADVVVGVTPNLTAEFRTEGKTDGVTLSETLAKLDEQGMDWTIVEGFKAARIPTILVGDIEPSAVGGEVLFRVQDGTTVDGSAIWDRIQSVAAWSPDSGSVSGDRG